MRELESETKRMAHHPRKAPRQTANTEAAAPLTILLVENNPGDVRLTKERFAEACVPCTIHVTRTLDETLAFLDERDEADAPVDAVLLDGRLSTEADDSLLRRLTTAAYADLPLYLVVQTETEAELINGSQDDPLPYLLKPVDPDEVFDRVRAGYEHEAAKRPVE